MKSRKGMRNLKVIREKAIKRKEIRSLKIKKETMEWSWEGRKNRGENKLDEGQWLALVRSATSIITV